MRHNRMLFGVLPVAIILATGCGAELDETLAEDAMSANAKGGGGEVVSGTVEDHTSVPEPNTHLCGVKVEGSSFEGVVPLEGVTPNAVWVKASGEICCIAGLCPEEGPPSCECYAVTEDGEAGTMTIGFAPGFVEGPQEGSEGLVCHEISFILFESACQPPPEDPEPPVDGETELPADPEVPVPEVPVDPNIDTGL
jgi:hypothetical protein